MSEDFGSHSNQTQSFKTIKYSHPNPYFSTSQNQHTLGIPGSSWHCDCGSELRSSGNAMWGKLLYCSCQHFCLTQWINLNLSIPLSLSHSLSIFLSASNAHELHLILDIVVSNEIQDQWCFSMVWKVWKNKKYFH